MVIPRWQEVQKRSNGRLGEYWNKLVAIIAITNLSWIIFDISYIPLRSFWVNRTIDFSDSISLPLRFIPDPTTIYDQFKGINKKERQYNLKSIFNILDNSISKKGLEDLNTKRLLSEYRKATSNHLSDLNNGSSIDVKSLERIIALLKKKSGISNYQEANNKLLQLEHLRGIVWNEEKKFWEKSIMPILETSFTREINAKGKEIDYSWKIDLPFQIIFFIGIIVRLVQIKRKLPSISLREAILRRWIDLPLLLPTNRLLRILPVSVRVLRARLIATESIRSVTSKWIVALLATEIFEVLTVRAIDSIQNVIQSPMLPEKVRGLCSHQSINKREISDVSEFIRIWMPLLLKKIGPNMRNQLIKLFDHAIQKNMKSNTKSISLKGNLVIEKAESAISYQLATGMIDTLLGISKNAGNELSKKDIVLEELTLNTIDRFWEELAVALENEATLKTSQLLLISMLEELKVSSLNELKNQSDVNEIIDELDKLSFNQRKNSPK